MIAIIDMSEPFGQIQQMHPRDPMGRWPGTWLLRLKRKRQTDQTENEEATTHMVKIFNIYAKLFGAGGSSQIYGLQWYA